jgi:glycosyltransferase involved in cell wall biosynthesis
MKILHVIVGFNPKLGGPVNSCTLLTNHLSQKGHDVTIITSDYMFDADYAHNLKNVNIISFPTLFRIGLFIVTPGMKKWLKDNIKQYDVIHLHEFQSYQNNVVSYYASKNNVPYILQARGLAPSIMASSFLKRLYNWVWGNKILKNASYCFALTKTELNEYTNMSVPLNKLEIIPNGIEISEYADLPPPGKFRMKYQIPEDDRIILSLGRIHKIKGIDLLLTAFSQLCYEKGNVKLVIAGPDDGDLSRLKKLVIELNISEKVFFVGPLYGRDKLEAYCDATVFVFPSIYEAFGNTVIESLACGTPVIATTGCHIADVVRHAGIIVNYDADRLADAIDSLVKNEKLAKDLGKKGRELIFKQFDQGIIIDKVLKIYQKCEKNNKRMNG